jgi:MFS family permease
MLPVLGRRVRRFCDFLSNRAGTDTLLNTETLASSLQRTPPRAFAALANPDFRIFLLLTVAAMMADNIEHVISYWVVFQKFHSPALGGFAVVSHWVPFLLLAAYSGALADRFDIRRLIQVGMGLFMTVSASWGILFFTNSLTVWKAMLLLVVHGLAGVIWMPASQVLIHQIVGAQQLPSAVRMNASGRYIGFLVGPAVGAGLLLLCGPAYGIGLNALLYAPYIVWLVRHPSPPVAAEGASAPRPAIGGLADVGAAMRVVARNPTLFSMTLLAGAASFFIGTAYQAQMPGFAIDLGHGRADFSYSMLLAADAAGGLTAGLLLESRGLLPPKARTAFVLAALWCCALGSFAMTHVYGLAIALLFVAGFVELAFNAMAQTLVQMNAPEDMRGRVIGVFSMSSLGLRAFSGVSVGLLGASFGIHRSLAFSAAALLMVCLAALAFGNPSRR